MLSQALLHQNQWFRLQGCSPKVFSLGIAPVVMQTNIRSISMFPDQAPSTAKPKISPEERRRRTADRLKIIRLKMAIGRELDDRGITTPAAIGDALGMPPAVATKLLTRHHWREGMWRCSRPWRPGLGWNCRNRPAMGKQANQRRCWCGTLTHRSSGSRVGSDFPRIPCT